MLKVSISQNIQYLYRRQEEPESLYKFVNIKQRVSGLSPLLLTPTQKRING